MISGIRIYILYLHAVLIKRPGPASQYDASKQHVHGKFHILSLESKFLEIYLALLRNEPKQCINTWQTAEVLNSAKRHADNSGNHADL